MQNEFRYILKEYSYFSLEGKFKFLESPTNTANVVAYGCFFTNNFTLLYYDMSKCAQFSPCDKKCLILDDQTFP